MNPENTFFSVKRFIGRKMNEVKEESKQIPYQVRSSICLRAQMHSYVAGTQCTTARVTNHKAMTAMHAWRMTMRPMLCPTAASCLWLLTSGAEWYMTMLSAPVCCLPQIVDESSSVKIKSSNAGKNFAPEEISALVLRKLTDDAAKFLNDKVDKAVITVPAYFNDSQRQVRDCGAG